MRTVVRSGILRRRQFEPDFVNETYQLFKSDTCGFCHRVRHYLAGAGWDIPLRDTMREPAASRELIEGGGRSTVPCLRIDRGGEVSWLYESLDIIEYLESHRAAAIC